MMGNVTTQLAAIADLATLLPLVQAYHEFENLSLTDEQRENTIQTLLTNQTFGKIWLIDYQGQTIGYITLCFGYSIEFAGRDAFIDEFFIQSDFRGQGLGKEVLRQIKIAAKIEGIRTLHLEVAKTNLQAQKLYSGYNFQARDKYVLMSVNL